MLPECLLCDQFCHGYLEELILFILVPLHLPANPTRKMWVINLTFEVKRWHEELQVGYHLLSFHSVTADTFVFHQSSSSIRTIRQREVVLASDIKWDLCRIPLGHQNPRLKLCHIFR